jgi:flagellar hook-basal body complex protein FliE
MSIEPIGVFAGVPAAAVTSGAGIPPAQVPKGFGELFTSGIAQVNQQLLRVDADARALAAGQSVSLHQVMIDLEEAKLSFELLAHVRNKLLEGFQEVMKTQV